MAQPSPGDTLREIQENPSRRWRLREHVERYLDLPSALTAVLMLLLVIAQFDRRARQYGHWSMLALLGLLWLFLILEFLVKLALAPSKEIYLRRRKIDLLYVAVPVLAVLRLLRPLRAFVVGFLALIFPIPESARPQIAILKRRRLDLIVLVSALVALIGATLGFLFEVGVRGSVIHNFGDAIWWSAALVTTVASQLYPVTAGGEVVAFLLMVYSMVVFGYLASSFAAAFIAGDAQQAAGQAQQAASEAQQAASAAREAAAQAQPAADAASPSGSAALDGASPSDGALPDAMTVHLTAEEVRLLRALLERLDGK